MSITNAEIILRARKLTGDPVQSDPTAQHWLDADYCRALQQYVDRLTEREPECLLQNDGTMVTKPAIPTDGTGTFPVGDHYQEDATFYLAFQYYNSDSEDTRDRELADKYLKLLMHVSGEDRPDE